jgi:hypothetical protein
MATFAFVPGYGNVSIIEGVAKSLAEIALK